ncbi:MAG: hypothetical protein WB562_06760 [Candidatus Sulfotelmatobacter sp.]
MDHPCHKCSQTVEDGVPFCSHCGAPQIRVTISPPAAQPASGADALPTPEHTSAPGDPRIPAISLPVVWSHAAQPCAVAGAVAVLLTLLGLNPLVTMLGAGVLAVVFYRYRNPLTMMRAATGARLGALSGLFGFGMSAVLAALYVAVFHKGPEIRNLMLENIQQNAARYSGPQYQAALDLIKSPAGLGFMMAFALIFGFVAFLVLGSLGGALSAAFLGRHDRT